MLLAKRKEDSWFRKYFWDKPDYQAALQQMRQRADDDGHAFMRCTHTIHTSCSPTTCLPV